MNIKNSVRRFRDRLTGHHEHALRAEQQMLMLGTLLSLSSRAKKRIASLHEVEFKVFSQWGDDGIIQWLVANIEFPNHSFVEFGVENYRESNTRFLMMHDNWSGLVMDGSPTNVAAIVNAEYYWKYDLQAVCAFIDRDNINGLLAASGLAPELGILHIDLDGNDFWIWQAIKGVNPVVLILEYNAVLGIDRAITVPYDPLFERGRAHHSNLYYGASLRALHQLSAEKGYAFIGCSSAGNNAYFVRRDKLNAAVTEVSLEAGFVPSRFRESRDAHGRLSLLTGDKRLKSIAGLPVFNTATQQVEPL